MTRETAMTSPADRRRTLTSLYGAAADEIEHRASALTSRYRPPDTRAVRLGDEHTAYLISYPDQFIISNGAPLAGLRRFHRKHLRPWISGIHILPFYPWSSDDGYSVIDHTRVDPRYGTWEDITQLSADADLMFDAVVNHVSTSHPWFNEYLAGNPGFDDYFISLDPGTDLSEVVRPRATPLLTRFNRRGQPVWVWTTFSADQVDLNYRCPEVFLAVLEVLLHYARQGATMIRLDAVQFLWKEVGTASITMPQSHDIIRLLRSYLDEAYPDVAFVTETNVPHQDNLRYLGDGRREAQMVYQFALPPLVLDAMNRGEATILAGWARHLSEPPPGTTYFNFLSSHDGVGVRPVEDMLPPENIASLVELTRNSGGDVGVRNVGKAMRPYELNATWFSLMAVGHTEEEAIARHLASHAVMFALQGVPAIYALSFTGTTNDRALYTATSNARSLNRTKFDLDRLDAELADPTSTAARIMSGMKSLLELRVATPAFHPEAQQRILETPPEVIGIERGLPGRAQARVYVNFAGKKMQVPLTEPGWRAVTPGGPNDTITLDPWESVWLRRGP